MSLFLSVLFFVLSLFNQGSESFIDLPTPAGECNAQNHVVLQWHYVDNRNVGTVQVVGWVSDQTFTLPGYVTFDTGVTEVKVGDPYTLTFGMDTIKHKTLPFSWQCNGQPMPTSTPMPTTTPLPASTATPLPEQTPMSTSTPTPMPNKQYCRLWLDSDMPNQPVVINFNIVGYTPLRYDDYTCGQHILLRIGQSELTEFYTWGESGLHAKQPVDNGFCGLPPIK